MIFCSLALVGIILPFPKLAVIAFIDAIACFLVRYYVLFYLPFGSHTLILMCWLVILFHYIAGLTWKTSFTATLIGYLLLALLEITVALPVLAYFQFNFEQATQNPWLHIVFGWTTDMFLLILALFCYFKKIKILDLKDEALTAKQS